MDTVLGNDGHPDKSSILVLGQAGLGKQALGYWFIRSGLTQGDYSLCVTRRTVPNVLRAMKGFGIPDDRAPDWMASAGSVLKCDLHDATAISYA